MDIEIYEKFITITCDIYCKCSLSYSFLYCSMSGQKVKKDSKDLAAANGSVSATMKKALMSNSTWEDKVRCLCMMHASESSRTNSF